MANSIEILLNTLRSRKLLHQTSIDEEYIQSYFQQEEFCFYLGFDCTANSLHVGHLLPIIVAKHMLNLGHKIIILIGDTTTKIGDPSGRTSERPILTEDEIEENAQGILQCLSQILGPIPYGKNSSGQSESYKLCYHYNSEWLESLSYIDLLSNIGRYQSVNVMLTMDSVKSRLDSNTHLSFLEFNYMILQGYDFMSLHNLYGCNIQIGGADQWGNMLCGIRLAHKVSQSKLAAITVPLLTTSDGKKMGKSESGAIWLHKDMLSDFDYFQFWRNVSDEDVILFSYLLTDIDIDVIQKYENLSLNSHSNIESNIENNFNINDLKIALAFESTKLCRGEEAAIKAKQTAFELFSQGMSNNMESFETKFKDLNSKLIIDILVETQLSKSKSEARKLIQNGGCKINDIPVPRDNINAKLTDQNFNLDENTRSCKLSAGKKRHVRLILI